MSKSLGNYIGVNDSPSEMWGKLLQISDDLMWRYFELLSFKSNEEIAAYRRDVAGGANPRDIKARLAEEIVARFHGEEAVQNASKGAGNKFKWGETPDDMPEFEFSAEGEPGVRYPNVMQMAGLVDTTSRARSMMKQGAIRVDGEPVKDAAALLPVGGPYVCQAGKKKFAKVTITP